MAQNSDEGAGRQEQHEQPEFWRKQEYETEYAYNAFATYRDLGIRRRLRAAAGIFYDRTDVGPTDSQYDQFRLWSRQHLWTARVEVFDAERDLVRIQETEERRREMLDDHWRAAKITMNGILQKVFMWQRDPESIPNGQVASLMTASSQLMRLTLGEPSERLEAVDDADAEPRLGDLSKLTYEEVVELELLIKKTFDE